MWTGQKQKFHALQTLKYSSVEGFGLPHQSGRGREEESCKEREREGLELATASMASLFAAPDMA